MESLPEDIRPLDLSRHAKTVVSRELRPEEALPPETARIRIDSVAPRDTPPVVDPTRFGRRYRKPVHAFRYRLSRFWAALGILLAAASLICTALGDQHIGRWLGLVALPLTFVSIVISWTNRLSARNLGYAFAAAILTVVALAANSIFSDLWP